MRDIASTCNRGRKDWIRDKKDFWSRRGCARPLDKGPEYEPVPFTFCCNNNKSQCSQVGANASGDVRTKWPERIPDYISNAKEDELQSEPARTHAVEGEFERAVTPFAPGVHGAHLVGVFEGVDAGEAVLVRHKHILQQDVTVLHAPQPDLQEQPC